MFAKCFALHVIAFSLISRRFGLASLQPNDNSGFIKENATTQCRTDFFEGEIDPSNILESILAENWEEVDPHVLSRCLESLKGRGTHRCWHKHSTFLQHLLGVHSILRLWGQGKTVARVGLFHSAYSNSYVNLALYDPVIERDSIASLVGEEAEAVVYTFCIIDRQEVVVNTLLRQGFIPPDGLYEQHMRNKKERVFLSTETLRLLVVFTMADIADQYFG